MKEGNEIKRRSKILCVMVQKEFSPLYTQENFFFSFIFRLRENKKKKNCNEFLRGKAIHFHEVK